MTEKKLELSITTDTSWSGHLNSKENYTYESAAKELSTPERYSFGGEIFPSIDFYELIGEEIFSSFSSEDLSQLIPTTTECYTFRRKLGLNPSPKNSFSYPVYEIFENREFKEAEYSKRKSFFKNQDDLLKRSLQMLGLIYMENQSDFEDFPINYPNLQNNVQIIWDEVVYKPKIIPKLDELFGRN